MEELILSLGSRNIEVGNLISQEITAGNYLKALFRGPDALNYRRNPDIRFVENLTIHVLPLRWQKNPVAKRLQNILRVTERKFKDYIEKRGKPDLIFHHGIFDYTYITRHLAAKFDIPYWYKEHSSYINAEHFPCSNDFETPEKLKEFVRHSGRRFAASAFYAEKMGAVFSAPFEVLHNVLTDQHFSHELENRDTHSFLFLNVAIMLPAKNQQLIVRAFAKAFGASCPECKLAIAGDGNLHSTLQALCQELGISEKVQILKFQNRSEIKTLLSKSHAFVLASDLETFGVVLIEAMGFGMPVISSRIPGPMELVNDKNGLFFEPGNVDELAEAMKTMVQQYHQFDQNAIKDQIVREYGPDSVVQILLDHPLFSEKQSATGSQEIPSTPA